LKTTSISLLERLQSSPEESDWRRLQEIYLPLICKWFGRVPGLGDDAMDLAQEVFVVVIREIPQFRRQREGSFRAWLRLVTVNRLRSCRKKIRRRGIAVDPIDAFASRLADANSDLAREWDREHDRHVVDKLLAIVRPDFGAPTWRMFEKFAIDGRPAAEVAAKFDVSVNAVIQAKARILRRLRHEAGAFLE
jgi:RNA polymerase sigma-70 factor (ECF subfamily)